jgi:predicted RNA-binding Zn-ribbon protein involved in translation (DUF1610 family)
MSNLTEPLLAALSLLAIYFLMLGCYELIVVTLAHRLHQPSKTQIVSGLRKIKRIKAATTAVHTLPVQKRLYLHLCPACGKKHFVNAVRHRFAYGTQLACSPDCDIQKRRQSVSGSLW